MTKTNKILSLAALMAIATACKKEPIPDVATSKQTPSMAPTDTIPRVPMDPGEPATMLTAPRDFMTMTLGLDWGRDLLFDWDSVQYVANIPYRDSVKLTIIKNEYEMRPGCYTPDNFLTVCTKIAKCIDSLTIKGKIPRGQGTIWVASDSLPAIYSPQPGFPLYMGIALPEQQYLDSLGFTISVFDPYRNAIPRNSAQTFGTNNHQTLPNQQNNNKKFQTATPVHQFLNTKNNMNKNYRNIQQHQGR